jgi:N-acetylglucosamine-6-phosphate deacetylase
MIVLGGGDVVLRDRIQTRGSLILDGERIAAVETGPVTPAGVDVIDASNCFIVPGFIDVHVHGVAGHDTLDDGDAVAHIARALPRYGVTAFCPTTVACGPDTLQSFLDQVRTATGRVVAGAARVLPAHLESNFINPDFRGAQPLTCLRTADEHKGAVAWPFTGSQILEVIERAGATVGIVTLAPELPGGIDLVRALTAAGRLVSIGHSGADFDIAVAAIEAGARHATHLFNRMTPMAHRAPGLAGAVLARHEVAAELICDGFHVHPAMCIVAIAAKGPARMMAITDATSGAGLPVGATSVLGGQTIHVRDRAAFLDDGTLAGSTLTMDRAFQNVVTMFGRSLHDAVLMCSTTPAGQLGLSELGRISEGAQADLVMLDRDLRVVRTFVAGRQAWPATTSDAGMNTEPAASV